MGTNAERRLLGPPPFEGMEFTPAFRDWLEDLHFYVSRQRKVIVERVKLAASDSAAGVFTWEGPKVGTSYTLVVVRRVILAVETGSTGACTINVGTAANSSTSSDTLIDGADVSGDYTSLDNIKDKGTNGKEVALVGDASGAALPWITGSVATGASAGLVGTAQIEYVVA